MVISHWIKQRRIAYGRGRRQSRTSNIDRSMNMKLWMFWCICLSESMIEQIFNIWICIFLFDSYFRFMLITKLYWCCNAMICLNDWRPEFISIIVVFYFTVGKRSKQKSTKRYVPDQGENSSKAKPNRFIYTTM